MIQVHRYLGTWSLFPNTGHTVPQAQVASGTHARSPKHVRQRAPLALIHVVGYVSLSQTSLLHTDQGRRVLKRCLDIEVCCGIGGQLHNLQSGPPKALSRYVAMRHAPSRFQSEKTFLLSAQPRVPPIKPSLPPPPVHRLKLYAIAPSAAS